MKIINTNEIVRKITEMPFKGNVVPLNWLNHIVNKSGQPSWLAIFILSDIIYWYRGRQVRNQDTGGIVRLEKRFKEDMFYRSYTDYAKMFNMSINSIKVSMYKLIDMGLVVRELRDVQIGGGTLRSRTYFAPVPEKIAEISDLGIPVSEKHLTAEEQPIDPHTGEPITLKYSSPSGITPHHRQGLPPITNEVNDTKHCAPSKQNTVRRPPEYYAHSCTTPSITSEKDIYTRTREEQEENPSDRAYRQTGLADQSNIQGKGTKAETHDVEENAMFDKRPPAKSTQPDSGSVPDLSEVKAYGEMHGIPADICENYHVSREIYRAWWNFHGILINWQLDLIRFWDKRKQDYGKVKKKKATGRPMPLWEQKKLVEEALLKCVANPESGLFSKDKLNDENKAEYLKLIRKLKEIKKQQLEEIDDDL